MPYIGRGSDGFGIRETYQYTATASQTAFTGSDINSKTLKFDNGSLIDVLLNGVMLKPTTDWTSSGSTVTLTSGASTSDEVMIIVYDVFVLSDAMPKTGGAFTGALSGVDVNGTELILDVDGDSSITADTDDTINFKAGGSDRLTINSSGDIDVETGDIFFSTAGKGINLGVTSNTDSNTLDDYEEGTWTAAISTTSGSITPDASFKTGHYTKIGKLVTVNLHLRASSVSSPSGSCQITGLPFTTVNNDEYRFSSGACVHFTATGMDAEAVFICYISENQSKMSVAMQNGNNLDTSTADNFTTNTEIYINLFYYV